MSFLLAYMERVALAVILGGGIVMASGVRPLLVKALSERAHASMLEKLEQLSIGSWNRYNRFAFLATAVILGIQLVNVSNASEHAFWRIIAAFVMMVCLFVKFVMDRRLRRRVDRQGADVVGSRQQNMGHRVVELLSIIVLAGAAAMTILPF